MDRLVAPWKTGHHVTVPDILGRLSKNIRAAPSDKVVMFSGFERISRTCVQVERLILFRKEEIEEEIYNRYSVLWPIWLVH